jgi:hypothetical protein
MQVAFVNAAEARIGMARVSFTPEAALERGYPPGLLVVEPRPGDFRADDRFHAIIVDNFR